MSVSRNGVDAAHPSTPEPTTSGFHAQLDGASLWDLVQMECLARSHLVIQVTGEGGTGYLYFDAGRVVHATTARNRGVAAAYEILDWTSGTFEASNRSWPTGASTIEMTHESLLLNAAKARDDRERGASNLVAFPGRAVDMEVDDELDEAVVDSIEDVELLELEQEEAGEVAMRNPNIEDTPTSPSRPTEASADFPVMLRLAGTGAVIRNKGGTEELAEAAAYVHRLVQLTGELLGLEDFVAIECTFTEGRCLLFGEGDGDIVVLKPRADLNLQALRERLGL
ncbi:MAG: response regulator receiver protein [Myxococcales bacterium]|nr:response regulator receiver protein [Myxococcales bacterium]